MNIFLKFGVALIFLNFIDCICEQSEGKLSIFLIKLTKMKFNFNVFNLKLKFTLQTMRHGINTKLNLVKVTQVMRRKKKGIKSLIFNFEPKNLNLKPYYTA